MDRRTVYPSQKWRPKVAVDANFLPPIEPGPAMTPSKPSAKPFALRPHPHLYEINTWAWLEKLSARAGRLIKLGDIPDGEWDALARSRIRRHLADGRLAAKP